MYPSQSADIETTFDRPCVVNKMKVEPLCVVVDGRERMQKMELQLESLSKWVQMNLSSGNPAATTTTTTIRQSQMRHGVEGLVSSSSGTCSSAMSSQSPTLTL